MKSVFVWFLIFSGSVLLCAGPLARPVAAGEVSPFNECATLRNMSDQSIMGVIRTAPFKVTGGAIKRHEGTFRLEPDETAQVCSTGPFYDGYRVELVLRTIMPLFTCKTRLSGEILLKKTERDDGITKLYADCK